MSMTKSLDKIRLKVEKTCSYWYLCMLYRWVKVDCL